MLTRGLAVLAAASLVATPAAAVTVSPHGNVLAAPDGAGYHGGWHGGWRGRHRDRVDAGDVLAGVLILGTIAAVANGVSKANERRTAPYPPPPPPRDYRDGAYRDGRPGSLDGAADLCVREVERDVRVRDVTRVERSAGGWLVAGEIADGDGFTCSIGADGRIDRVDIGGRVQGRVGGYAGPDTGLPDRQYGDDIYRSARANADAGPGGAASGTEAQPAYPGGPMPGEDY